MLLALCPSAPVVLLAAPGDEPPRFEIAPPAAPGPLSFVVYGDTRFTARDHVANALARRALVAKIADENPAAILIGGDLIYQGTDRNDYSVYHSETLEWDRRRIPVFPALGNHEFHDCNPASAASPCLENWWQAFAELKLRPFRWYSVAIGREILALVLDSDSPLKPGSEERRWLEREITSAEAPVRFILIVLHYPPVRDPVLPRGKDEAQVQRYLSAAAPTLHAQVIVVGSHVHNYERFSRDGVTYLVSGGGGAKPLPVFRMSGELSNLQTSVNFHFLRFTLDKERLTGTMVRFDAADQSGNPWSEPDRFEIAAR